MWEAKILLTFQSCGFLCMFRTYEISKHFPYWEDNITITFNWSPENLVAIVVKVCTDILGRTIWDNEAPEEHFKRVRKENLCYFAFGKILRFQDLKGFVRTCLTKVSDWETFILIFFAILTADWNNLILWTVIPAML